MIGERKFVMDLTVSEAALLLEGINLIPIRERERKTIERIEGLKFRLRRCR